jgi:uncharacterized protein involved in exopolysaccharide biosynthesis
MRHDEAEDGISLCEIWTALRPHLKKIVGLSIIVGVATYGFTLLIPPTYTARATIMSPQPQQNSAASALAALGGLTGLAGGSIKSPADQYVAIMQSATVSNRLIERFKLMEAYEAKFKEDARKALADNVRISAGKKDNLITIEVDDKDAIKASQIANSYVEELRWVTNNLALTESQQRRVFFEQQLGKAKQALQSAQEQVEKTGFTAGALKSEPKAAAEAYARTKAEIASTQVRLDTLRRTRADSAPEVQQALGTLNSLRGQLAQYERPSQAGSDQNYVAAYREFKYQEALFEIYAKQLELAKMDEAREGTLIQVLDSATPPERRSKPKRASTAASATLLTGLALTVYFMASTLRRRITN